MITSSERRSESRGDDVKPFHRNAARYAEAVIYSMDNPYLTKPQKALVEAWFQFPIGMFCYLLMAHLAAYPYRYVDAFAFAYIVAGMVSVVNLFLFVPDGLLRALGFLFAGYLETSVGLAFIVLFLEQGAWGAAAIAVGSITGVLSILAPSMHLYTVFSPAGLNAKYAFAKSRFGITFPFENRDR